jgi:hypothetical protein
MFQTKFVEKIKYTVYGNIFLKTVPFMRKCGKMLHSRAGHR